MDFDLLSEICQNLSMTKPKIMMTTVHLHDLLIFLFNKTNKDNPQNKEEQHCGTTSYK